MAAGVKDVILTMGVGFWRNNNIINAFVSFWSSATNSFIFPFGEMSITLWDLKGVCGLPVCGATFDECTPSNFIFSKNPIALKVVYLLEE